MNESQTPAAAGRREPPQSLDALRELVARLNSGDESVRLGQRAFRTLVSLVDAPHQAAVYSITELAVTLGVNASTLTRLAKRLGYAGFGDFQDVFRRHIATDQGFYSRRLDQILGPLGESDEQLALVARVAEDEAGNIAGMLQRLDSRAVDEAVGQLCSARAVRIHGLRQFYSLATLFAYGLGLIRNDVALLGDAGHGIAHALAQLRRDDLLVVLGCNPYTRGTIDAARTAASMGIRIIALTDSVASPLARDAGTVFVVPVGGRFFGNSTAAWTILIEGLLVVVARRLGTRAVSELRKRERLFLELGIAVDGGDASRG